MKPFLFLIVPLLIAGGLFVISFNLYPARGSDYFVCYCVKDSQGLIIEGNILVHSNKPLRDEEGFAATRRYIKGGFANSNELGNMIIRNLVRLP